DAEGSRRTPRRRRAYLCVPRSLRRPRRAARAARLRRKALRIHGGLRDSLAQRPAQRVPIRARGDDHAAVWTAAGGVGAQRRSERPYRLGSRPRFPHRRARVEACEGVAGDVPSTREDVERRSKDVGSWSPTTYVLPRSSSSMRLWTVHPRYLDAAGLT